MVNLLYCHTDYKYIRYMPTFPTITGNIISPSAPIITMADVIRAETDDKIST